MEQVLTDHNSESYLKSIVGHDEGAVFRFHILMIVDSMYHGM
jgi:hypothetical protein